MVYIKNISTSQQVYIPRQTVNTGSTQNGGCLNLEDYYTREEVDELIEQIPGGVTQEYVDEQDAATLQSAKDYADTIKDKLNLRIGGLFDYHSNTLYLNNIETNEQ